MKLAIMQPYFLPYIGYWQLINSVDKFLILDNVNYIKKGWINKNKVLVNGKEFVFTIPLQAVSQNKIIRDIKILDDSKWKTKFLKTIHQTYFKSKMFNEIYPIIEDIIQNNELVLLNFISFQLELILRHLEIETEIDVVSELYPEISTKGQQRILDICVNEKASCYINLIGGKNLYDNSMFEDRNIKIKYLESNILSYPQHKCNSFVSSLSIVDILMNVEPKEIISRYLPNYTLH